MTDSSAALRTAVANLHPRERRAMRHECDNAARRWADMLPTVANVWHAMGVLIAEIDEHERARAR